jgi:hypothetical protein
MVNLTKPYPFNMANLIKPWPFWTLTHQPKLKPYALYTQQINLKYIIENVKFYIFIFIIVFVLLIYFLL